MPEAEVSIQIASQEDLAKILTQNGLDLMKTYMIGSVTRLLLVDDGVARYGNHERSLKRPHLHWEELKTYSPPYTSYYNPYICNHSLKWDASAGINIL